MIKITSLFNKLKKAEIKALPALIKEHRKMLKKQIEYEAESRKDSLKEIYIITPTGLSEKWNNLEPILEQKRKKIYSNMRLNDLILSFLTTMTLSLTFIALPFFAAAPFFLLTTIIFNFIFYKQNEVFANKNPLRRLNFFFKSVASKEAVGLGKNNIYILSSNETNIIKFSYDEILEVSYINAEKSSVLIFCRDGSNYVIKNLVSKNGNNVGGIVKSIAAKSKNIIAPPEQPLLLAAPNTLEMNSGSPRNAIDVVKRNVIDNILTRAESHLETVNGN